MATGPSLLSLICIIIAGLAGFVSFACWMVVLFKMLKDEQNGGAGHLAGGLLCSPYAIFWGFMHRQKNNTTIIMIVWCISMLLSSIAGLAFVSMVGAQVGEQLGRAQAQQAEIEMMNYDSMLSQYNLMNGSYPDSLDALTQGEPPFTRHLNPDPWGQPYNYKVSGESFELSSSGPDQTSGTGDDIIHTP